MDTSVAREHLDQLLTQEVGALATLQLLLDKEYDSIANNDVAALESAGAARQACVGELLRIEDERRSLCRMLSYPTDAQGIDRLLAWCDPTLSLRRRWSETLTLATECRGRNERNGALVTAKLKRVEGLLSVITGRQSGGAVYGRNGLQHLGAQHSLGQA